jgi:hypothetical protein
LARRHFTHSGEQSKFTTIDRLKPSRARGRLPSAGRRRVPARFRTSRHQRVCATRVFRVERPSLVPIKLAQFRQHAPRGLCRSLVLLGWHSPQGINRLRPAKRSVERQTHDVPDFGRGERKRGHPSAPSRYTRSQAPFTFFICPSSTMHRSKNQFRY